MTSGGTWTRRTARAPPRHASFGPPFAWSRRSHAPLGHRVCVVLPQAYGPDAGFAQCVDGLKRLYKEKIMPLEEKYKFVQFHGPLLTDGDFEAKPMVRTLRRTVRFLPIFANFCPNSAVQSSSVGNRLIRPAHGSSASTFLAGAPHGSILSG